MKKAQTFIVVLLLIVVILIGVYLYEQGKQSYQSHVAAPQAVPTPAQLPAVDNVPSGSQSPINESPASPPKTSRETFTIATWNIEAFGPTKAGNLPVIQKMGARIHSYDLIAIQEIRDSTGTAFPRLMDAVNAGGYHYTAIVSPRLGRSTSKEQYAFIYNPVKIQFINGSDYVWNDTQDVFEREPYFAKFNMSGYVFTIGTLHTRPESAQQEINDIPLTVKGIDGDVILLGDLNADCNYYVPHPGQTPGLTWMISDDVDTTVRATNCAYDRILVNDGAKSHFISFGIDQNVTWDESDHDLIWGLFGQ